MFKSISIVAVSALMTASASAQVFVIGSGLGGDCYQKTKSSYHSFRSAEETCTRALREETMTRANRAATYVNRGVLRMREGRYEEAEADYQNALDIQADLGAAAQMPNNGIDLRSQFRCDLPGITGIGIPPGVGPRRAVIKTVI